MTPLPLAEGHSTRGNDASSHLKGLSTASVFGSRSQSRLDLSFKMGSLPAETTDDVAIIGFSCRFPGEAKDGEAFWELLCNAKCSWPFIHVAD